METYREILCRQVDTLQAVFDSCHNEEAAAVEGKEGELMELTTLNTIKPSIKVLYSMHSIVVISSSGSDC